jgi:hypothetical protein
MKKLYIQKQNFHLNLIFKVAIKVFIKINNTSSSNKTIISISIIIIETRYLIRIIQIVIIHFMITRISII